MKNLKLKQEMLVKLENLLTSFKEVEKTWNKDEDDALCLLANEYPFDSSFDELTLEVGYWLDYQKEYLLKK